jgi:adenylate cyclase
LERKLTAILCADVYGYSRLMGADEEATLRSLSSHRKVIGGLIEQHRGRFVNAAGDSVLAEFASVVNAVQCALEIQATLKSENASFPPERRMEFRIGINLGDVIVEGEQIYGDGVNVAARLESLAQPGGICISGSVQEQIGNKLALQYLDLGEQTVKNIAKPVRVFRVLTDAAATAATGTPISKVRPASKNLRRGVFSVAGLAIIVGTIVLVQHLSLRPPLTSASIQPAQNSAPPPLPDKLSIAVLPFSNLSGDREQEYLSDGITTDLITALARLPDLFVIDRNSAFTYKGKVVKVADVGRELGVKYVLEGGLRKVGDQIRITTELVDAATGDQLWGERYDCSQRDFSARQDEIVQKIVTTLNLAVDVSQRIAFNGTGGRTNNPDAYDAYLRGEKYAASMTKEDYLKAQQMFEKAIELDPKYTAAYVALGYTLRFQWNWLWNEDPDPLGRAFKLAQQAIALDESMASAHGLMSAIYLAKSQFDQALAEAQRAVTLDPNSADSYNALAYALDYMGKPEDAIEAANKAMRLDPRHRDQYLIWVGLAETQMKHYSKAVPIVKQFQASYPNVLGSGFCFTYLMVDYVELGQESDARTEAADLLRFSPDSSVKSLTQRLPFKDQTTSDLFLADFQKAGLK